MSASWPSDDDRPPEDDLPQVDVVVPDDARDLDADVRAYHREQRRRHHEHAATHGAAGGSQPALRLHWAGGWALSAGLMVVLGVVAVLLAMFSPRAARTGALPITGNHTAAPGEIGGTLPDTTLTIAGKRVPVIDLRPAVLALVPPVCRCTGTLQSVRRQSMPLDVPFYVVERPAGSSARSGLPAGLPVDGSGGTLAATDHTGVLSATYLEGAPTFVLVHADGVVREVLSGVRASDPLGPHLTPLRGPGARW